MLSLRLKKEKRKKRTKEKKKKRRNTRYYLTVLTVKRLETNPNYR